MKRIRLFTFGCLLFSAGVISAQNYQINAPDDDAEESAGFTTVILNSPVIDLTSDPADPKFRKQIVGLRFNNVQLQKGTSLSNCYLQFRVAQASSAVTYLSIRGEKTGNAAPFQAVNRNLSMRPKTIAKIIWNNVEAWTQDGTTMKSPDLSQVLTEIINQPEWQPGNSIALYIEGNGDRHASAFESGQGNAIQLVLNGGAIAASSVKPAAPAAPVNALAKPETQQATPVAPASKPQTGGQSATPVQGSMKSGNSLEETINSTQAPVKVGLASQIEVTIPQGVAPEGTKISIAKTNYEFKYSGVKILNAMDVSLSCGSVFEKPLEIKLYFDRNKLEVPENADHVKPAYFDELRRQWVTYPEFNTNAQEGWITFKTSHLTTVSLYEFLTTGLYTMKLENDDCTVYYCSSTNTLHTPMKNSDYNGFKEEPWYKKEGDKDYYVPYLIQDIAHWVSEVKNAYKGEPNNLWVPTSKINIYVRSDGQADGEYGSWANCIYINNTHQPVKDNDENVIQTTSQLIKSLVAHEFLHMIQDNYYFMELDPKQMADRVMILPKMAVDNVAPKSLAEKFNPDAVSDYVDVLPKWWFEGMATQGDCIAYGKANVSLPESEKWAQDFKGIESIMAQSWGSLNKGSDVYGAGFFLHYLSNYRQGYKMNLALLLKQGGLDLETNNLRTVLDNRLKSGYESSISKEWEDFSKWAYQNTDSKYIRFSIERFDPTHILVPINPEFTSKELTQKIPYLSARIIKLRIPKNQTEEQKVETIVKSLDPGIKLFMCDIDLKTGNPKVIKELKVPAPDQSGMTWSNITTLNQKYYYTNILAVNTNKDNASSFSIFVKNVTPKKP